LGDPMPTQFSQALEELSIGWIGAYSPQAKGRIERFWMSVITQTPPVIITSNATTLRDSERG
jgi:hypothetical protein